MVPEVTCYRPYQERIQEVERVFGRKGRVVIDVRWLLQPHKRRGKAFSSLVGFLSQMIRIAKRMCIKKSS